MLSTRLSKTAVLSIQITMRLSVYLKVVNEFFKILRFLNGQVHRSTAFGAVHVSSITSRAKPENWYLLLPS